MNRPTYSPEPAAESGPLIANVTGWNDYPHYGMASYRIWVRHHGGIWQQRHEWRMTDGQYRLDPWITSIKPAACWLEATTMHRCAI